MKVITIILGAVGCQIKKLGAACSPNNVVIDLIMATTTVI